MALFVVIGFECYLAIGEIKIPDVVKSMSGALIVTVIGSKECFFGASSRADTQADRIIPEGTSPFRE
ncbi:hypothetical protein [Burkholderia sp. S-53]|uniref:hypothetical protein n=1 Tax=Burkholderia sp. S-53 TaxID=2906514 RepID=UPI0021D294AB|nr:hypothetical protein [Burkholderia sp. S-53]UXU88886.1 hypothetical protein LXM88_10635 [Burkholderia sp. S-53]